MFVAPFRASLAALVCGMMACGEPGTPSSTSGEADSGTTNGATSGAQSSGAQSSEEGDAESGRTTGHSSSHATASGSGEGPGEDTRVASTTTGDPEASSTEGGLASSSDASTTGSGPAYADEVTFCREQLDLAVAHYRGFLAAYQPARMPRSFGPGGVRLVDPGDWTSGFPAGSLWYLYEHTGDPQWLAAAQAWTDALYGERHRTSDHDIGFIIGNTYGNGLRIEGTPEYADVIVTAAQSLTSRFRASVGAIRSWDFGSWQYPVIIDNMMNLELLFVASELSGDPSFAEIARSHADKTLANHFRSDASSYHVVDYNPTDGGVIRKQTNQGLRDESAWARGQAWGLYGYMMSFRKTADPRYLERARAIADFYIESDRVPDDGVPYFDFDAPIMDDVPDLRDASAGAIATSALLELATLVPGEAGTRYRDFALHALHALASEDYRAALGTNGHFLLLHSVGNYPIQDEVDVAINYADYYFIEALMRCAAL